MTSPSSVTLLSWPAAPVQASVQEAQPSPAVSANSFSSHLKTESSSEPTNVESTASKIDKAKANNSRESDKSQRPKASFHEIAALLGTQIPYQQVLDDRKLQLSLERTAGQDPLQKSMASLGGTASAEAAKSARTNLTSASQSKGGVAFGANLHMNSAQISQGATQSGTQAVSEAKNSGGKNHQGNPEAEGDESTKKEAAVSNAVTITPAPPLAHSTAPIQEVSALAVPQHVQNAYVANATSQPVAPAPTASVTEMADTPTPVTQSRSIDLRVGSTDDNAVNVRVSQRAGDVQVTVRTPDTDLAQSLRQHLPELSDRLAQSGVHGDLWQPSTSSASNDQSSDNGSSGEAGQGQNAHSDAQSNQKQQDKNQSAWLNQMYEAESTQ